MIRPQSRCAYSCGAVAEFHRLPEHPGDCRGEFGCAAGGSFYDMEQTSISSTFINGSEGEVKDRIPLEGETAVRENGDPGEVRTPDPQFRKLLLYPPELRGLL